MDIEFLEAGTLVLTGVARDLKTSASGDPLELGTARVQALVGATRALEKLDVTPGAETSGLLGLTVAGGFRAAVDRVVPGERDAHSPLYLLLDELPVATLISGYAMLYLRGDELRTEDAEAPPEGTSNRGLRGDICSGWRADGVMMRSVAAGTGVPTPVGPPAPTLESSEDPLGWHSVPTLPAGAMRRRRLIDVAGDAQFEVTAMFRDSHVDPDGIETVLHEYALAMVVEQPSQRVVSCEATPRTLPWPECPAAALSATRLEGHRVGDLRSLVRTEFHGTSTCTHLNDLLRSLADVEVLIAALG